MNKKILTSMVVLSGLLFGGDVFAADYMYIRGEGICEMALPANAIIKKEKSKFEFMLSDVREMFFNDDGEYVGFDNLLKKIRQVLPDAVITSYKYDYSDGIMFFNIDTKLQKDLIGLVEGVDSAAVSYYGKTKDISEDLTEEFKSSKEYLDCKDMATKSAMKNAMDKAKILKAKIVGYSMDTYYIYKIEDGKIRYYRDINYKAIAD